MEYTLNYIRQNKGFTLIEVLIVLTVISLVFTVLSYSLYNSIKSSIEVSNSSNSLKDKAIFFWDMERKFFTAKEIFLKNNILTLYNTSGYTKGLVKSVFFVKDGFLWYYEFPYVYADPYFYDEKNSIKMFKVKDLKIYVVLNDKELTHFEGLPDYLIFEIDGTKMELR
jgi:prepilin-type N-terminal cleavage/methylation domain-containing protein